MNTMQITLQCIFSAFCMSWRASCLDFLSIVWSQEFMWISVFKMVGNKLCYVAIKATDFLWSHHVLWVPQNLAKDKSYLFRLFNIYMLIEQRNMIQFMRQGIFHSNLCNLSIYVCSEKHLSFFKAKKNNQTCFISKSFVLYISYIVKQGERWL